MKLLISCVALVSLTATGYSQYEQKRWILEGFTGRGLVGFLGSEDPRVARGLGLGYAFNTPNFLNIHGKESELIVLGYYHRSTSKGVSGQPANGTDAFGTLGLARYYIGPRIGGMAPYAEAGLGIQFQDQETVDQSSTYSFSPTVGVGISMRGKDSELMLGVRLLHLSNAGTRGNNQGSNQILITMGLRF